MTKISRNLSWLSLLQRRKLGVGLIFLFVFVAIIAAYLGISAINTLNDPRSEPLIQWVIGNDEERRDLMVYQRDVCPGAHFVLPADGFIGLLYGDPRGPYSAQNPHQGIDIFSNTEPGLTPVYAAYDGYITREENWQSTIIQRVPSDPLNPGQQIWLYYTHMADRQGNDFIENDFSPGTSEFFVKQGTLLGYTGDYNGSSLRDIWVHLHFSIVKDDGNGRYTNELEYANTIDPSPYLGLAVHYDCSAETYGCTANPTCGE